MKLSFIFILCLLVSQNGVQDNKGQYVIINDVRSNLYPTVESILAREEFKDKIVYIDLWGVYCGPCLKEFKYSDTLKTILKDFDVAFLYLSSPYTSHNKTNKLANEIIKEYNLTGTHVFISAECYQEGFWIKHKDKYSENRMFGIPTYLLVNKSGQIVDYDAPRPSDYKILKDKIYKLQSDN